MRSGLELESDGLLQKMKIQVCGDCERLNQEYLAEKQQRPQSRAPQAQQSFSAHVLHPASFPGW